MKKILYVSNIEVPYRVRFFNEFSKCCELTVVYTRKRSSSRDEKWSTSEEQNYNISYLKGIRFGAEDGFSLGIIRHIFNKKYDSVIFGCYNSPTQMLAILLMRLFKKPYILSTDGEVFISGSGIKTKLKRFFLGGAQKYLTAGEKSGDSIRQAVGDKPIIPYYFSSMNKNDLQSNSQIANKGKGKVLVVSQYLDVKGIDLVVEAAKMDNLIEYKIIGTGNRTEQFIEKYAVNTVENIEVIPFLQKKDLEEEYKQCSLFVLPSRQECWGLVINEAASFGVPIVSTWGSGAAVEFLSDEYSCYLAEAGNGADLYNKIKAALNDDKIDVYSQYLIRKSAMYSIEQGVQAHCKACEIINQGDAE